MSQDIISDCLNRVMNAKKANKTEIETAHCSRFLIEILKLMKEMGYLDYHKEDKILKVEIKEQLNECRAIKPRYTVSADEIDRYVRRFLPAKDFGFLIISTSRGLMTHETALKKNIGGILIAYIF